MRIIDFICILVVLSLSSTSTALAIDTTYDTGRSKKDVREKSMQRRRSEDRSRSAEATLQMDALFRPVLLNLEHDTEPWKSCRVLSTPLMPADVGLSAIDEVGLIDSLKSEYLNQAAHANSAISGLADEARLINYRNCLALYGAVIGDAYQQLRASLPKVAQVAEGKNAVTVTGLSRNDMQILSRLAVEQTVANAVKDNRIRKLYSDVVNEQSPCRFAGHLQHFVCGAVGIIIGPKPQLIIGGVEMYGDRFAGLSGQIVARASKNEGREKVLRMAQSWDRDRRQHYNVSVGKLIPGLHQ
jgi:hypothetical protein